MNNPDELIEALKELDSWLENQGIALELEIVGSFALYLRNVAHIHTKDIDTAQNLDDKIVEKIAEIGARRGLLPFWLSDDCANLPKPKGFETRLTEKRIGAHLILQVASRWDLIQLKAASYIDRGNENPKDLTDLKSLQPTQEEIDAAIEFIRATRRPEKLEFYPNYEEMIEDVRHVCR